MTELKKRLDSQREAEKKQDAKRASLPRYGGRCSQDEKDLIKRLADLHDCDEKTVIFKALKFYESNIKKELGK